MPNTTSPDASPSQRCYLPTQNFIVFFLSSFTTAILEFEGYATDKTSRLLWIHRRVTYPVMFVRQVIGFQSDTKLRMVVKYCCVEYRVRRQCELSVVIAVQYFVVACVIAPEAGAESLIFSPAELIADPQI